MELPFPAAFGGLARGPLLLAQVLGAPEFAKPRSSVVDALDEELSATEVAAAFATLKKSTFGELSADLPALSQAYGVPVSL